MVASYLDMVGAGERVALGDLHHLAVMVAGAVEPRLVVEAARDDHEGVAVPAAHRLAHPRIDLRRTGVLQVDVANGAGVFVGHEHRRLALEDLEREGQVGGARQPRQVALDLGIAGEPVGLVLVFLLAAPRAGRGSRRPRPRPAPTAPRRRRRRRAPPWRARARPGPAAWPGRVAPCAPRCPSWRCSAPARCRSDWVCRRPCAG